MGVRVIALRCAGFNNVDTRACFGKLHVFRVPAYSPNAVAEHAMALLLTVNLHTNRACIRTRAFNFSLSGFDLHGKTVGVVGTGKIGRIFADICKGFDMRVLNYDKFPNPASDLAYVDLPELLGQADVISLHCPLTEQTRGMIGKEQLAMMKPNAIIVNEARGAVIDDKALVEALQNGTIWGAAIDTWEKEPLDPNDPLVKMEKVITTSHLGAATRETVIRCFSIGYQNILRQIHGEELVNRIV